MLYFLLLSVKKSEGKFENTKHYPESDIGIKLDLS